MKTQAIIPTAGTGTRLRSSVIKPLIPIAGIPLFVYSLKAFERASMIDSVILVVNRKYLKEFEKNVKKYRLTKVKEIVEGGKTRSQSVKNGLGRLDRDTKFVVVHDGVRPMVTPGMIDQAVRLCQDNDAVIVAVPVKPTIKRVDLKTMSVKETLPRQELWEVQTPQVFKKNILVKAHGRVDGKEANDDATLVEAMGVPVKVLPGAYSNIKVTTMEEVILLKVLLLHK